MGKTSLVILLFGWVVACDGAPYDRAVQAALRDLGQPISYCPKLKVVDGILKKPLPLQVTVQKVVQREFPEELVDQLLAMTGLNRKQTFQGANRGVFGTPGVRYYGSQENNHTLAIIPAQGWMHYTRLEAMDDKGDHKLTGPTEAEALQRGLEFAKTLGLKEADLARHPTKNRLDYLFTKIEGGSILQEPRVKVQGVFFRRAIDGIPVTTGRLFGGLRVEYGFQGMLYKFELVARATEPMSTIHVAPLTEQMNMVAEAKQVYGVGWQIDPDELRRDKDATLEVELAELVYFEDAPDKFQKVIPPLLRWEGQLKSKGQEQTVILYTPIKETAANGN